MKTVWTKMVGVIVEGGQNRAVDSEDGFYYISNFEDVDHLATGTEVTFLGGYPGDHRGVAIEVKKVKR